MKTLDEQAIEEGAIDVDRDFHYGAVRSWEVDAIRAYGTRMARLALEAARPLAEAVVASAHCCARGGTGPHPKDLARDILAVLGTEKGEK